MMSMFAGNVKSRHTASILEMMGGSARHALMSPTAPEAPSLCLMITTGIPDLTQTGLSAAQTPLHAGVLPVCLCGVCRHERSGGAERICVTLQFLLSSYTVLPLMLLGCKSATMGCLVATPQECNPMTLFFAVMQYSKGVHRLCWSFSNYTLLAGLQQPNSGCVVHHAAVIFCMYLQSSPVLATWYHPVPQCGSQLLLVLATCSTPLPQCCSHLLLVLAVCLPTKPT